MLDISPPSRGELLTTLRLWRGSGHGEFLTLSELKELLLSTSAIGMTEDAADTIIESVMRAHGDTVTCEQVSHLLVPLSRVLDWSELSETEKGTLRTQWAPLAEASASPPGEEPTIEVNAAMLYRCANEVTGLVPSDRRGDRAVHAHVDIRDILTKLSADSVTRVDLRTAFELFRTQQRSSLPPPSAQQLRALLTAHDDDGHGTLTVDKLKRVLQTFGYPDDKNLRDLIKESAIDSASRESFAGGWQPRERGEGGREPSRRMRAPPRVDLQRFIAAYQQKHCLKIVGRL
jgi:hypothetical protein